MAQPRVGTLANTRDTCACTGEPDADGDLGMTEEELSVGNGQAEIDCEEDLGDLCGRSAETIQGGAALAGKAFIAGLAA